MGLAGIKSEEESGGVKVQTAMSFFYSLLSKLDFGVEEIEDASVFLKYKETLENLQFLLNDTPEILKELVQKFPSTFISTVFLLTKLRIGISQKQRS